MKKVFYITLLSLFVLPQAHAIKKCKDADGKWHYGDIAVRECQNSKITTLTGGGFVKGERAAPKTESELLEIEAQAQRLAEEKRKAEFLESEKSRVLSIYETEADIDRQRENQLYSVDSNIAVHNTFLESMDEQIAYQTTRLNKAANPAIKSTIEKKIAEFEKNKETYAEEVSVLQGKREGIVEKFKKEKELYFELTGGAKK